MILRSGKPLAGTLIRVVGSLGAPGTVPARRQPDDNWPRRCSAFRYRGKLYHYPDQKQALAIQLRLPGGFVAGVEQGRGLGTVLRARTFMVSSLSVFKVETAAELAA